MLCFIVKPEPPTFYQVMLGSAFIYVAVVYVFQSIYHFYRPIPGLFDEDEKEQEEENPQEKPEK